MACKSDNWGWCTTATYSHKRAFDRVCHLPKAGLGNLVCYAGIHLYVSPLLHQYIYNVRVDCYDQKEKQSGRTRVQRSQMVPPQAAQHNNMPPNSASFTERMRIAQRIASQYIESGTTPWFAAGVGMHVTSLHHCGSAPERVADHRVAPSPVKTTRWQAEHRLVDQLLTACLHTNHANSTVMHTSSTPSVRRQGLDPKPSTPRKRRRPPWDDSTAPRRTQPALPADWMLHAARHSKGPSAKAAGKSRALKAPTSTTPKAATASKPLPISEPLMPSKVPPPAKPPLKRHISAPPHAPKPSRAQPPPLADVAAVNAIASMVADHVALESVAGRVAPTCR